MDHNYYRERISAYADNSLTPYEQMAIREHLESCVECRAALEKIQKLSDWIGVEGNLAENEYFEKQAQAIEERLGIARTEITPILRKRGWQGLGWKLAAAAASIAVVGVVAFYSKDAIWQKTDLPVMQQAAPPETVPSPAVESEQLKQPEIAPATKSSKPVSVPSGPSPAKAVRDLTPSGVPADDKAESNYKSAPQMMAPSVEKPTPEISTSKESVTAGEPIKKEPVRTVDELLKRVAGVKTDSSNRGAIHGTGASEVPYIIDGVLPQDTPADSLGAGRQVTVKAKRDVISKFEVSGQLSKTAEQIKSMPAPIAPDDLKQDDSLAFWRAVRDSLEQEKKATDAVDRVVALANRLVQKEAPAALRETIPETGRRLSLVEAYFRIAKLSADSTEIARATDSLKKIADNPKSPDQKQARVYLDSLQSK